MMVARTVIHHPLGALLVVCLLAPTLTTAFSQNDEDLIFDDEGVVRTRREVEVAPVAAPMQDFPTIHSRYRRQGGGGFDWGSLLGSPSDDEDVEGSAVIEGSGMETYVYRVKFHILETWKDDYTNKQHQAYNILKKQITDALRLLLKDVPGETRLQVVVMRRSLYGNILVTVDITNSWSTEQGAEIKKQIQGILGSRTLGSLSVDERDFSFSEHRATPVPRPVCRSNQHQCPSGRCVGRCNGVNECIDASDEFGCPIRPTTTLPPAPSCRSDDQGPNECPDGVTLACFCDGKIECPGGEDESSEKCDTTDCRDDEYTCDHGTRCILRDKVCDGVPDCRDEQDESNCPVTDACRSDEFRCHDGQCIQAFRRCDFAVDCRNGEDEQACPCEPPRFECNSGMCITQEQRCDGIQDCDDGTDETVNCPGLVCPEGQFRCDDGTCIEITRRCDGLVQCRDKSDEQGCLCGEGEWTCSDGSCVPQEDRCNRRLDCNDHSDEDNCPACGPDEWTCVDGSCIPDSAHCNRVPDCLDKSDEENCPIVVCGSDEWTCSDGYCVPQQARCDGRYDCPDYSDEHNCVPVCGSDEWRCGDGSCVPQQARCDTHYDCHDYTDEDNCPPPACRPGEWTCRDGSCVPEQVRCDGRYDCPDYTDEEHCTSDCDRTQWTCKDGSCIPQERHCDGRYDCPDYTDEYSCPPVCDSEEWTCGDGSCVPQEALCDGRYDCPDRTDEERCPEWRCKDGSAVPERTRCDGRYDCPDYSDEEDCKPAQVCRSDQFRCEDGQCLDLSQRCNGNEECSRGEDERGCQCRANEFRCLRDGYCISSQKQCDGQPDCSDGSDEQGCSSPPQENRCSSNQFECSNGDCVLRAYRCDGIPDCADGSDESDAECTQTPTLCPSNQFTCSTGECVGLDKRCDRNFDCLDNSDEIGCPPGPDRMKCEENEFRCTDGVCIDKTWRCDSVPDCSDASDETNCSCRVTEFRCGDGTCIPEYNRCDGTYDCTDGSDERYDCDSACKQNEFQCENGDCIPFSQRCNGYAECRDRSDEHNCNGCTSNEIRCLSGECVSSRVKCDGRWDCIDGTDERDCGLSGGNCSTYEFRCNNGFCVPENVRCDRISDCSDGSDELDCPGKECQSYEFKCLDGQCISLNVRCDGTVDCRDGSDEAGCSETPSTTTTTLAPDIIRYQCSDGRYIDRSLLCNGVRDCSDGRDEAQCETDSLSLRTYPDDQTIQQSREVVFQCRDEGTIRAPVHWVREGNRPWPPGTTDNRGRLTMPNIQVEHSGTYYCEAQDVPLSTPGRRKSVYLQVNPYVPPAPPTPDCRKEEATCMNGQCIDKSLVCNGIFDCSDASDEMRCNPLGCEPNEFQCDNKRCILKTWTCDSDDDCGDGSDERDCGTSPPGSECMFNEFTCHIGNQCIPKSFHCDGDVDCQDGTDEFGCSKPRIIEPPPRNKMVQVSDTFTLTCLAYGVPVPTVIWRLNWGHVPDKCEMTSEEGRGTLVCRGAQPTDQGAYSCEAINTRGSVFAHPDCIVQVKGGSPVCQPPQFNAAAVASQDCLTCFCFGATDQCYSTDRYITQLPPPSSESFSLVGVNQDQIKGTYVIRSSQYPLSSRYVVPQSTSAVQLIVDRTKLGGPSDLLVYFSLPDSHKGQQLSAYGGYLRYKIQYFITRSGQTISGPDVIIMGNNITLMHVHDGTFLPERVNQVDVRFQSGQWFKKVVGRGRAVQTQEPASREDIMMVLENMDLLLIRALYSDGIFVNSTLYDVQLDTAVIPSSEQGRAVLVEECRCPPGYMGLSCQDCAPNYRREKVGLWLGECLPDIECGAQEYGDPAKGIPCSPCPCPLSTPNNQFSTSCYLDNDGRVTCNCRQGYQGRRCEVCASGYEGSPNTPGDSCRPAGECDPAGSYSVQVDASTGLCQCKEFVTGPKCDQCKENTFYLNENNRDGCIECFCMGITQKCTSSNWYRQQEHVSFINDRQGFELVDKFQETTFSSDVIVDPVRQELVFKEFSQFGQELYYWKLPRRFLGNKISSYGGNLTYTLRYVPAPGGQSSTNSACAVELYGNDITLKHYSRSQLSATRQETVSVPLYEEYWERQDGQEANRQHFLMALADLQYILIKATYTTNSREVGLKEVIFDYAERRNTGQVRAYAVEMCECPQGYQGLSCEDCAIGYTRSLSGLYLGTCVRCDCNGHSEECDPETGICSNCRDNTAGDHCDMCAPGFYGYSSGRCIRLDDAGDCNNCDQRGTISCNGGNCQCKFNVRGDNCDACQPGFFHLSSANPDGCHRCWCSGVSSQCFSSNYFRTQLPMQLLTDHGFTFTNRLRTNVIRNGFSINVANNEISFADFANLRDRDTYYWSLPQMFTGNRLPSYGGNLTITQRYQGLPGGNTYADPDVIIRSSGGQEYIWMNPQTLPQNTQHTYYVPLIESSFTVNQQPPSRSEFLNALSSVDAIFIRATISDRMSATFLRDVIMDTAVTSQTGQPRALEVEQCQCPMQYSGLSCQQCKPGYYRDSATNECIRCPCNGHVESCTQLPDGSVRCDCLPGYYGPTCSNSDTTQLEGMLPVTVTIFDPRIQVAAVGSTVQFQCSARSLTAPQELVSVIWSKADGELPYGRATDNRRGSLEISRVQVSDSGTYICAATDGFGRMVSQNATLTVGGGPPRVIVEEHREVLEVRIGETLEVRCSAEGSPRPQVIWTHGPNKELPVNVFQQNGVLSFRSAQPSASGEYYCTATNAQGSNYARIIINVVAAEPPRSPVPGGPIIIVQVSKEAVEARSGESVRVSCSAGSTGRLRIEWSRLAGQLPSQAVIENGELQIPDAQPADSGIYVCRITDERTNRYEESTTRITITQFVNLPTVQIQPDRQTVNQGTTAELTCIVSGDPTPVITWSKVNEEFGAGVIVDGNVLRITNAVVNDRGMYVCTAQNEGGTAQAAAIVEVDRREPPVIEVYPQVKQTIVIGASALFQCHLTAGIPNPTVQWARTDGRPLTPNTETLNGGVLRFNQAQGDEEGSYTCTAENEAGTVRAVAILEIQSLPIITIRPGPSPQTIRIGERVRLECSAQGDPAPSVSWQKLQVNFPSNIPSRSVSPTVAVYEITSASRADEGTYQCTARNSAGVSEERIQLIIEDILPGNLVPGISPERPVRPDGSSSPIFIPVGGSYDFACSGHGPDADDLQFTFERSDGRPLPASARIENGVLYLTDVDESASGEYQCVGVDRISGSIIFTIYSIIEVLAPPRISLDPARQVVRPGEIVRIRCSATGPQPITINWSKESGYMTPSVIINGGEMMFRGIKTSDAGRYICSAINSAGTTRAVAEVIVNEEPLLAAIQQDMVMYVGQTAELRCEASGINPNDVRWTRIRGRLPPGAISRGNLLRLPFIQPEDSGRYQCEAITPSGYRSSDIITLTVKRLQTVDVRIRPSRSNVRIGDDVELICEVSDEPAAAVSWARMNSGLPSNAQALGNILRLVNVQPDNGGIYRCTVTTANGVFEESYALVIQDVMSTLNGHHSRSVETRSVAYGLSIVLECRVSLSPPVSYTWNKQGGKLPVNALVQNAVLDIPEVHTEDAGLYVCTGSNEERSVDLPTLLLVTGVVPRFDESSYLSLSTLPRAYLAFDLEISFKPESADGLILYNSQRAGREDGDFVSFGMSGGYAEFRFNVGSGPAVIRSKHTLAINQWHTVKLSRDRKEGTMIVDDGTPISGRSEGRFLGLDLVEPMYLGGVPDFSRSHEQTGFSLGFRGCISRLVIGNTLTVDLMRDAKNKVGITSCETCAGNPCQNNGVCQEAYTEVGHKCICPAGFSGGLCEDTGESCYPGVCGTGRCVNKPGGFECYCPFGKLGQRCEQDITIYEPAFGDEAYIAYPTPRALRRFSVDLNFKPENLDDGVLMYCAQKESGEGDFTSLAIRNKRLEFRFNTGSGTATIQSEPLLQGQWIEARANRTDRLGSLVINDGPMQNGESPGSNRGLNLVTPLFIGGVDRSRIAISPEVEVNSGFTGCVSEIKLMDQDIRLAEALVDSANVGQCGGSSSSLCSRNPCRNNGQCIDDSSTPHGYVCRCQGGYSGHNCEMAPGVCTIVQPCRNGGACIGSGADYSCHCPLGFAGHHCEHVVEVEGSASFSSDSWVEFDQSLLSQESGVPQKALFEFSTLNPEGLLFWYGQESNVSGRGQDYISVALKGGYVELSYELGTGPAVVRSSSRVDDGERHTLIIKRTGREGYLKLDGSPPEFGQSPGVLHMLNAKGNIYIGGVPDFSVMTGGDYTNGFEGCIHRLIIGDEKVVNFMDLALSGVNVTPCPRRQRGRGKGRRRG